MASKEAKTTTERQTSFREKKKDKGYSEVTLWLKNETIEKIAIIADSKGLSRGEVLDNLMLVIHK